MTRTDLLSNPMTTQGDVIYGGASGVPTRLAKGTADQVLTMNAGATAPEWADPAGATATFVGCRVFHSAVQSVASGAVLTFDSEVFDTDAIHSTASNTGRFTVPTGMGGKWTFRWAIDLPSGTAGQVRIQPQIDGTTAVQPRHRYVRHATIEITLIGEATIVLTAGQYVELLFQHDFGGSINTGSAGSTAQNYAEAEFAGA